MTTRGRTLMLGSLQRALLGERTAFSDSLVSRGFLSTGRVWGVFHPGKEPNHAGYYELNLRSSYCYPWCQLLFILGAWSSIHSWVHQSLITSWGVQLALLERLSLSARISFPSPLREGKSCLKSFFKMLRSLNELHKWRNLYICPNFFTWSGASWGSRAMDSPCKKGICIHVWFRELQEVTRAVFIILSLFSLSLFFLTLTFFMF